MIDILLNLDEQQALASCSLEATRLYVLGFRPLMDIGSGMVGTRHAVSYGHLSTVVQWRPPQGSKRPGFFPTIRQLRSLVDELERVGLIKRYSTATKDEKQLAVLLLLAYRGSARPAGDRHMTAHDERQPQSQSGYGFQGSDRHAPPDDERHMSDDLMSSFYTSSSSTTAVEENQPEEDESVIPETPKTPMQWIRLMKTLGFADSALSAGALAIYDVWLKAGLQVKQVQAAAAVAAKHNGRTVQYVARVLDDAAKRNRKLSDSSFEESPGKPWWQSSAGVESRAIQHGITRMDDEQPHHFLMRVYKAGGLGPAEIQLAFNGSPFQGR